MVSALALAGRTHRVWLAVSSILLRINHFVLQEAEITSSDFPVILAHLDVLKIRSSLLDLCFPSPSHNCISL